MQKRRILVVDDEVHITEIVRMVLERAGHYVVRTLNKSTNALDVARTFKPDLILLDLVMPGVYGDQLVRDIRGDQTLGRTRVLMHTTSVTKEEVAARHGIIGGIPFLPKPANPQTMLRTIEETLAYPN